MPHVYLDLDARRSRDERRPVSIKLHYLTSWMKGLVEWGPLIGMVAISVAFPLPYGIIAALAAGIVAGMIIDWVYARLVIYGVVTIDDRWVSERPNLSVFTRCAKGQDRIIGGLEVAMGGPSTDDWLLEDGAVIDGTSSGWVDVGDRFRVAMADIRHSCRCIVYDRIEHKMYYCKGRSVLSQFYAIENTNDASHQLELLKALYAGVEYVQLQYVFGLWIEYDGQYCKPSEHLTVQLRDGAVLTAQLITPSDARGMSDPDLLVRHPKYRIYDSGTETDVYSDSFDSIVDTGSLVLLKGSVLGRYPYVTNTVWHVRRGGRWIAMIQQHVTVKARAGSSRSCYSLLEPRIISDDRVEFSLEDYPGTPGISELIPVPSCVELRVSWSRTEILFRPKEGRITVRIPS